MKTEPTRSDLIELGRRAERAYDAAEGKIGPAGASSIDVVDADIGRDVFRRFCELRGAPVRFPCQSDMTALGGAMTLAVDHAMRRLEAGDADAYAEIGGEAWAIAAGARIDA